MIDPNFFKDKRILVTGHTGFKGGWLSIWLQMMGAKVTGFSLDPKDQEGIFNVSGIKDLIHDVRGDIRDFDKLNQAFQKAKPEIVFHLAAQALVIDSYNNPLETFETNVQGTANVLEAIRQSDSVQSAVIITTDKCYENQEWVYGYRETDPMGGHDPYSASKGAAELVISSYQRSFLNQPDSPGIASARAGNVIGGGDWSNNRLVPDIFRALKSNEVVKVRNPNATRPWQHVLEPLGAYLLLSQKLYFDKKQFSSAWNIGPFSQDVYTVKQVIEEILKNTKKGDWVDTSNPKQLHEANLLMLDISKAFKFLGWRPTLDFTSTVRMTSDWYMMNEDADVLLFSKNQINEYLKLWNLLKVD